MKYVWIAVLALVVLFGLSWISAGNDFFLYKYFAPKTENVRRNVFENTQSYVEGKIQNIGQECFAYKSAQGSQKTALAGEIRDEAATVDFNELPTDEQNCILEARGQ